MDTCPNAAPAPGAEPPRDSEEFYRLLVETMPQLAWRVSRDGREVHFNQRWYQYTGQTPAEVQARGWLSAVHPDDLSRVVEQTERALSTLQPYECVYRLRRASDGSYRWHLARSVSLRDPHGEVLAWFGCATDIDDLKRAQEALRHSRRRFRALTENASDIITIVNASGTIVYQSPAGERWLGYPVRGLVGRSGFELLHPEDVERARQLFQEVIGQRGAMRSMEVQVRASDGSWRVQEVFARNLLHDPTVHGVVINARDVSDRKQAEQEIAKLNKDLQRRVAELEKTQRQLEEAKDAAEAANQAKSRFLATISHELRTPLTAIIGFAEFLARGDVSAEKRRRYLQAVDRNGRVLLQLIEDIIDLSKIEAGEIAVNRVDVSPWQIVGEALSLTRSRAVEKHLDLQAEYMYPLPETIHTDPMRLRQILVNLLLNAIKFTAQGSVRVAVSLCTGQATPPRLQISVRDTGIGISPKGIAKLFRPFTQVDSSIARRFGGTGLGLDLSRRLARLLGGDIEVVSQLGQGSTFTLSVGAGPLDGVRTLHAPPELPATDRPASAEGARRFRGRVLLVEDDSDSREVVYTILKSSGLEVHEAENGRAGVLKALAAEGTSRYDLILMDVQMPGMDGHEATRWLRSVGWKGVIVALTAHAMSGDREKCLQAGCDDYLSKPITAKGLTALLARYLPPQTDLPAPPRPSGDAALRQRGALDDSSISDDEQVAMFAKFVQGLPARMDEIERALHNEDRELLARAAHRLAGAAGLFGFRQIAQTARTLEEHLQLPAGLDVLSAAVLELAGRCRQAAQAYQTDSP